MSNDVMGVTYGQLNGQLPPAPVDVTFRPGPGGAMTTEWAAYAMNLWWKAGDKKLSFAEAVKQTALHFMVGDQP